jgi:glycoside/pentoside/hexuronide:cation symporter, GPH family
VTPGAATIKPLLAYSTLRMPLALLELPLFVLLPNFYNRSLGLDLAIIGGVLFGARLIDALADPLLGSAMDRWRARIDFRQWIWVGLPVLALGFAAMLLPPVHGNALAVWLALSSIVTYLAYSVASIAYQSWGSAIGTTAGERARVTTTRESFGLIGVLAATALLSPEHIAALVAAFAGLSLLAGICLAYAPAPQAAIANPAGRPISPISAAWQKLVLNRSYRWLLAAFVANGVATAVPATLVLFFITDVLGTESRRAAWFLATFFLAGAFGMPLWLWLATRFGLRNSWLLGMALAITGFIWTIGLGRGDDAAFFVICVATGLALGSDLAMPPALLAASIAGQGDTGRAEGAYFGVWNLATKLNLALAAGLALPLLDWQGYLPGAAAANTLPLKLTYAALPSGLKLLAAAILLLAPRPDAGEADPRFNLGTE